MPQVIVHPLVLLSTVDHYNRVAKDTKKRVVGVLLGTTWKGRIDITNSFAGAPHNLVNQRLEAGPQRAVRLEKGCEVRLFT